MIEELQRFIKTAQEGNITKTASKIFITQSALSQSIKRLETALDTKLFTQQDKHLKLTTDGKAVLEIGMQILKLWESAKDPVVRKTAKQIFTIGIFDNAALRLGKYLQDAMTTDAYQIELTINNSGKLYSQLQWGTLDIAICVLDNKNALPKTITCIETFSEELIPVSSKKFKGSFETIPFILYNPGSHTRDQIDATFFQNNITPQIFVESTSATFMKELAILGSGIALLPKNFVAPELKQGLLKKQRLPFQVKRQYGLFVHNQSTIAKTDPIIKKICSVLRRK